MLFHHEILTDGSLLGIWKMEESIQKISSLLSKECLENERYLSISNPTRKLEFLSVRLLLKTLCKKEKTIIYNEAGKPSLEDNSYKISISHTKNYVAVLLHRTKELGIDIESISERVLKIKERFMSIDELSCLDKEQTALHSLLFWSAKETVFKAIPESDIDFIEHIHIEAFKLDKSGNFNAKETRSNQLRTFEIRYSVYPEFVLTYTSL